MPSPIFFHSQYFSSKYEVGLSNELVKMFNGLEMKGEKKVCYSASNLWCAYVISTCKDLVLKSAQAGCFRIYGARVIEWPMFVFGCRPAPALPIPFRLPSVDTSERQRVCSVLSDYMDAFFDISWPSASHSGSIKDSCLGLN